MHHHHLIAFAHHRVGMKPLLVPVHLHVPLEFLVTLVALVSAGRQVAALYVVNEGRFVGEPSVADVADEALLHLGLLGEAAAEALQHAALLLRRATVLLLRHAAAAASSILQQQPDRPLSSDATMPN